LKAWRKVRPSRSRRPFPLSVCSAIVWRFVTLSRLDMGSFALMLLSTFCRPSQLLELRQMDLMPPTGRGHAGWHMPLSPQELHSKWPEWATPLYQAGRGNGGEDRVWSFTYPQYVRQFRSACLELNLEMAPYQSRHSGPAIDRSRGCRTLQEIQKRGGWQTHKCLVRNGRSARLNANLNKLSLELRGCCRMCEAHLEEIVLGCRRPEIHLP
jgi:hypothetical protein